MCKEETTAKYMLITLWLGESGKVIFRSTSFNNIDNVI